MVSQEGGAQQAPLLRSSELFDFFDSRELTGILSLEGEGCVLPRFCFDQCNAANVASGPLVGRQKINNFPCIGHNEHLLLFYLQFEFAF